jgi:hypothetical protein
MIQVFPFLGWFQPLGKMAPPDEIHEEHAANNKQNQTTSSDKRDP